MKASRYLTHMKRLGDIMDAPAEPQALLPSRAAILEALKTAGVPLPPSDLVRQMKVDKRARGAFFGRVDAEQGTQIAVGVAASVEQRPHRFVGEGDSPTCGYPAQPN